MSEARVVEMFDTEVARFTAVVMAANEAMESLDVTEARVENEYSLYLLRLCWQGLELLFVRPFQREEEALNVTPWSPK